MLYKDTCRLSNKTEKFSPWDKVIISNAFINKGPEFLTDRSIRIDPASQVELELSTKVI